MNKPKKPKPLNFIFIELDDHCDFIYINAEQFLNPKEARKLIEWLEKGIEYLEAKK